jgi:E3 ubiquitin-protein ligase SIAH1
MSESTGKKRKLEGGKGKDSKAKKGKGKATNKMVALAAAAAAKAELEAHLKEQLSQLDCPICLTTIPPPIFQCPEGHLICRECKDRLVVPKQCPLCKVSLSHIRNLVMEKLVAKLEVPCPNAGCKEKIVHAKLREHLCVCEEQSVQCFDALWASSQCRWEGPVRQFAEHCEAKHGHLTTVKLNEPFNFRVPLVDRERKKIKKNQMFSKLLSCDGNHFVIYVGPANDNVASKNYSVNAIFYGSEAERSKYRWQVSLTSTTSQLSWGGCPVTCKTAAGVGLTKERVCHTQLSICKALLLTRGMIMNVASKTQGTGKALHTHIGTHILTPTYLPLPPSEQGLACKV